VKPLAAGVDIDDHIKLMMATGPKSQDVHGRCCVYQSNARSSDRVKQHHYHQCTNAISNHMLYTNHTWSNRMPALCHRRGRFGLLALLSDRRLLANSGCTADVVPVVELR